MIFRILYTLLYGSEFVRDITGTRIYAHRRPAGINGRHILMRLLSSTPEYHLENEADLANPIIQIDCYGDNERDATELYQKVHNLLSGYDGIVTYLTLAGTEEESHVSEIRCLRSGMITDAPQDASDKYAWSMSGDFEVFHSQDVPTHV